MARSKHTRPARIIAADRVRDPRGKRGEPTSYRTSDATLFEDLGIEAGEVPDFSVISNEIQFPKITVQRPRKGYFHPASTSDIRKILIYFGEICWYGVREISLMHTAPGADPNALNFGELMVPGKVVLFEQPIPPWLVGGTPEGSNLKILELAGAVISVSTDGARSHIEWPGDSLKKFMLFDVLLHEIGHHIVQQFKGKREAQLVRRKDHETLADSFAQRCRASYKRDHE